MRQCGTEEFENDVTEVSAKIKETFDAVEKIAARF
jgi:hypothetical protein